MNKDTINTTFNTPLLNDCTNHLAFQLKQAPAGNKREPKKLTPTFETLCADIVTHEFIRGYN
ncbi:hypothetical protein [Psychromonas sp. MME2]|uniref:hypothetical protein n=1 Tax=unclassified Psychromonas TaxID=2614957 RepID=UPI00339BCE0E